MFQGLLFSTGDCLTCPVDLMRFWMHETHRVYGDKLVDDKDIENFLKLQIDALKKNFEVSIWAEIGRLFEIGFPVDNIEEIWKLVVDFSSYTILSGYFRGPRRVFQF